MPASLPGSRSAISGAEVRSCVFTRNTAALFAFLIFLTASIRHTAAADLPTRERVFAPLSKVDDPKYELALKLTVHPTFRSPVVVELFASKAGGIVRVFRTWGMAGYYEGDVEVFLERATFEEDFANFRKVTIAEVLKMPDLVSEDALDGDTYSLEIRSGEQSRKIEVSGTLSGPLTSINLESLSPQVRAFAELSESLLNILAVYPCARPAPPQTESNQQSNAK